MQSASITAQSDAMSVLLSDIDDAAAALATLVAEARRAVVFTGAGLSTESGIPDYRSAGGIWSQMEPITYDAFCRSEEARMEDWRRRFMMGDLFADAEPNAAHRVIAQLATTGPVTAVITQNIDGLHRRSGVPEDKMIELHGCADHATCLDCHHRYEVDWVKAEIAARDKVPRCTRCGGLIKAAIVSFGQMMPADAMDLAEARSLEADVFFALGSSLVVYPAAGFPRLAKANGARLVIASSEPTDQDDSADVVIRTPLAATFAQSGLLRFD